MSVFAGLPSFVGLLAILYLVAESGSRWVALVACAGLLAGLLVGLRRDVRRRATVQAGAEDPAELTIGAGSSEPS